MTDTRCTELEVDYVNTDSSQVYRVESACNYVYHTRVQSSHGYIIIITHGTVMSQHNEFGPGVGMRPKVGVASQMVTVAQPLSCPSRSSLMTGWRFWPCFWRRRALRERLANPIFTSFSIGVAGEGGPCHGRGGGHWGEERGAR